MRSSESCKDPGNMCSSQRQWQRKAFKDKMSLARVTGVWYTREEMLENEFGSDSLYFVSDLICFISGSI